MMSGVSADRHRYTKTRVSSNLLQGVVLLSKLFWLIVEASNQMVNFVLRDQLLVCVLIIFRPHAHHTQGANRLRGAVHHDADFFRHCHFV